MWGKTTFNIKKKVILPKSKPNLGNLVGTFTWEPCGNMYDVPLGTLRTLSWEPWELCRNLYLKTFFGEPLLGNLVGTSTMETLATLGSL